MHADKLIAVGPKTPASIWSLANRLIDIFLHYVKLPVTFEVFPALKLDYGHLTSNFLMKIIANHRGVTLDNLKNQFNDFVRQVKPAWLVKVSFVRGFANFEFKVTTLFRVVDLIMDQQFNYGRAQAKDILYKIEIISANPTGFLHVGHVRNGLIGDSLGRILAFAGYRVMYQYYLNDHRGGQQNINLAKTIIFYYDQICHVNKEQIFLADYYRGVIYQSVAKQIYERVGDKYAHPQTDKEETAKITFFTEAGIKFFLNDIKKNLTKINVHIDEFNSEDEIMNQRAVAVKQVLAQLAAKQLTFHKDGAFWFKTTQFGEDKDRVLIKSNGTHTYFLPDLVNHWLKFQTPSHTEIRVVDVWGADHHSYERRMRLALSQLSGVNVNNFEVIITAMVMLTKGNQNVKLSKRKGTGIWLHDLLPNLEVDLLRFIFCSKPSSHHLKINLVQLSTHSVQNPFFYWQYAVVRCVSLFTKLKEYPELDRGWQQVVVELAEPSALKLVIKINQFNHVLAQAVKARSPHFVCDYGYKLATLLHEYYAHTKIIDPQHPTVSWQRIKLMRAVWYLLTICLRLLGISPKSQM